jgi:chemotaxis signal transduction protein
MTEARSELTARARALAQDFDATFAEAPHTDARQFEDLLAIRLGGEALALRLSEVAGLFARRNIVRLPSALPELLGLVSLRAAIVPVYDLGALLTHSRTREPRQTEPRWLVLAASASIALAFDELEGYQRLPADAIITGTPSTDLVDAGAGELVRTGTELRSLIRVPSLIEGIAKRVEHLKKKEGSSRDVR